ncbi:MAG: hypothetical protein MUF43_07820, partial [Flavobacterium sp.]|nr:hypothetical protein [Flavobacterium sp.]
MEKNKSLFLIILCVLTIIGSVFTILRGFVYELFSTLDDNHTYFRGWIYIITSFGTLTGAILMLQKKFLGLLIYTFFQIAYLITVSYATSLYFYSSELDYNFGPFAVVVSSFFIFPS